ncbi:hypothetical protein KM043_016393 [Ampulex compressa]|nr:hypothetical protein KM043_016393 [Ampulex compressa]
MLVTYTSRSVFTGRTDRLLAARSKFRLEKGEEIRNNGTTNDGNGRIYRKVNDQRSLVTFRVHYQRLDEPRFLTVIFDLDRTGDPVSGTIEVVPCEGEEGGGVLSSVELKLEGHTLFFFLPEENEVGYRSRSSIAPYFDRSLMYRKLNPLP